MAFLSLTDYIVSPKIIHSWKFFSLARTFPPWVYDTFLSCEEGFPHSTTITLRLKRAQIGKDGNDLMRLDLPTTLTAFSLYKTGRYSFLQLDGRSIDYI